MDISWSRPALLMYLSITKYTSSSEALAVRDSDVSFIDRWLMKRASMNSYISFLQHSKQEGWTTDIQCEITSNELRQNNS